MINWAKSYEKR